MRVHHIDSTCQEKRGAAMLAHTEHAESPSSQNADTIGIKRTFPAATQTDIRNRMPSAFELLGVAGFGTYLSWLFLMLMNCGLSNASFDIKQSFLAVLFFLFGEGSGAAIAWLASHHVNDKKSILILMGTAGCATTLPGASLLFDPLPFQTIATLWFIGGVGSVLLLSLWGFFLSKLGHAEATLLPALAALVEVGVVILARYFMDDTGIDATLIALPIMSTLAFFFWAWHQWHEGSFVIPANTRPPDWRSLSHSSIAMVANSFLIGFVIYVLFLAGPVLSTGLIFIAFVFAACFKAYDALHKQIFEVRTIIKVIAPTATACLLLSPFFDIEMMCAVLAIVMFVSMTDEIICWSAVSEYMHVHRLMPLANIAYGRLGDTVGIFLGYLCGFLIFGTDSQVQASYSITIAITTIAFVVVQAFFFRDNYTPFTEHKSMDKDLKISESNATPHETGRWKNRCLEFAAAYGLTPRQEEVLLLLAKGYSTGTIEKQLVVSNHTVKAHIYNIYRKTDVHTRQELIEKIEHF